MYNQNASQTNCLREESAEIEKKYSILSPMNFDFIVQY